MKTSTAQTFLVGFLAAGFALNTATAAPTKEDLKARFESRHDQVVAMKSAGKVGETAKGYLEAVTDAHAKDAAVKQLLDAENADRKALYGLLAQEQKTTIEEVGRQNAIFKFKKAAETEFFKGKDDTWRKKADMLKK